ncbi:Gti1/Pac2 family-domain-containing protein [Trametes gibbosa]|nr:Gti1/Pac2 family-domain-containing protein [Trametes gibbosa]
MSGHDSQNNGQWTEPPWSGWIETTGDALLILEAARRGLIPRVTRRLVDSERKMITSGSVFVFDEDESGIKRWTDGFFWSPSRILGNFLLYRETEKRGAGHSRARAETAANEEAESLKQEGQSLSRPKSESSRMGIDRQRERILVGSLTNSYKFKPGGMMKKVRTSNPCSPSTLSLYTSPTLYPLSRTGPGPCVTRRARTCTDKLCILVRASQAVVHYLDGHHRERHNCLPQRVLKRRNRLHAPSTSS